MSKRIINRNWYRLALESLKRLPMLRKLGAPRLIVKQEQALLVMKIAQARGYNDDIISDIMRDISFRYHIFDQTDDGKRH